MSREVCGICWCPYDDITGECACVPSTQPCPNCASLEAQNTELDKKLADLEQTSLELCETCGWRTLIPGDVCLNCTRSDPDELTVAYTMGAQARRRLTDAEIGEVWFAAKIPGLTETQARLLIRAAERRLAGEK